MNGGVSAGTESEQGGEDGPRATMTWVHVCVFGRRVVAELLPCSACMLVCTWVCVCMSVSVSTEEISDIASQCSCPEWETKSTQRNRYMVQVFWGGTKTERETDCEKHPSRPNGCVSVPDDTMVKYGAYWPTGKINVQNRSGGYLLI